ncbi:hypothetical protein ECZU20_56340 [Escherichia coli]|nr:hypothetical protein ECZU20_56340 [Escherichia coli]
MTGLKAVLSFIGTVILVAFGAFGFGRMKGREKAEDEAEKQRINENAAAVKATAERRIEVTKRWGMYSRVLTIWLMTMLIASCGSRGSVRWWLIPPVIG